MSSVIFTIEGTPQTNARARHGKGRTFTPNATRLARREVVEAFQEAAEGWIPHEGPVKLMITIRHATPPKDLWDGRFCKKKPDVDNVAKLVADALNGVAYLDDAQIVLMRVEKHFAVTSGVDVGISFYDEVPRPLDGLVKEGAGLWCVYDQGELLGRISSAPKGRGYLAFTVDGFGLPNPGKRHLTLADADEAIQVEAVAK